MKAAFRMSSKLSLDEKNAICPPSVASIRYGVSSSVFDDISEWKLSARSFTSDFEKALINAASNQFSDGFHVGCIFHLKQAWRQYLTAKWVEDNNSE